MKIKRYTAFLTAFVMTLSLSSCKLRSFNFEKKESKKPSAHSAGVLRSGKASPTTEEIHDHVEQLLGDIKKSGNTSAVKKDIELLVYDVDACNEALAVATIDHYCDRDNDELAEIYDSVYETLYVCNYIVSYAFAHGYVTDEYGKLFAPYINDEEEVETLTAPSMSLKRIEGYARVDFEVMDENLDAYYDIVDDDSLSSDDKAIKCAELYLDILSGCDPETFYTSFNRDYTPDDIVKLCDTVRSELIPAEKKLIDALREDEDIQSLIESPFKFDTPFGVISDYAGKLSPDIEKAAKLLNDEELFVIMRGDKPKSYQGSFTNTLPVFGKPFIYIYDYEDYTSLETPLHEFGHFYALLKDDTPSAASVVNLDVAEVQSQGFEFIFSRFYDDIYGSKADAMQALKTCDMLESIIMGFLVGEFEYTVLSNRDKYSPEDVVECFRDIFSAYSENAEFYMIPHVFESPGYYISYGVSALAAFDIWQDCLYAPDEALEKYEKIANVPCNSADTKFCDALMECGFSDVLDKKYIKTLAEELLDYADEFGE